ncbi:MAG: DUF4968 domain-containing protein, partial [Muribaculaceae bacterium]|nr:DUF4968 domain-containing protein [Muribaculaceae bacterium]
EKERVNVANINTSLAVYRPGDKMEWLVIVFGSEGNLKFVGNDLALNVTLHDVNHKQLAEVEVTTDAMGRARGEFDLPEGGLTGYYYITANYAGRRIGGRNVMVSDYKLPTFEVKLDSMTMEDSLLMIKGSAMTYAGFPVQVASAELELKNDQRFAWWRGNSDEKEVIKVAVEFDAGGVMTFRMLQEDLDKKLPYPDGLLSAKLTVVATSGESHEATMTIALAKRMHIVMGYMDNINVSQQAELPIFVCNSLGEEVVAPVELTFTQKGAEGKTYRFTVLTPALIRLEYSETGAFVDSQTHMVMNRSFPLPAFHVEETENELQIITDYLRLKYNKKAFSAAGLQSRVNGQRYPHSAVWYYGDEPRDLLGTARTLDEADGSIPLEHGVLSAGAWSLLDDSGTLL